MAKTATKKPAAKKPAAKKATKKKSTKVPAKSTKKKPAAKKPAAKKTAQESAEPASELETVITIDRRDGDRRNNETPVAVNPERRKVARRRQIDPTTCERDYSDHEIEFMQAMDAYKRASGRMFPTCSEILEVVRSLGYCRPGDEPVAEASAETADGSDETMDDADFADCEAGVDSDSDFE